jgi:hypothetical protein
MVRKTVTAVCAVVCLSIAVPLAAQDYEWSWDRPDAVAPLGVYDDHTLEPGQFMWTYRYHRESFDGLRFGEDLISADDAFGLGFNTVPVEMRNQAHEFEVRFGLADRLTVSAQLPYWFRESFSLTDGGQTGFASESQDLGDTRVNFLYDLFEVGSYRAHAGLGVSLPSGELDDKDVTVASFPNEEQLPFNMQTGAGTWDILPTLNLVTQNEHGTVGLQGKGVIRVHDNNRDYTLGDRFMGTLWAQYRISDWVAASARVNFESWGDVDAPDPDLDPGDNPAANPLSTGGSRTTLPLGLNVLLREGPLSGLRMYLEWHYVISEDLNGPQLSQDDTLVLGWQVNFGYR